MGGDDNRIDVAAFLDTASIAGTGNSRAANVIFIGEGKASGAKLEMDCSKGLYRFGANGQWASDDAANVQRTCNNNFDGLKRFSAVELKELAAKLAPNSVTGVPAIPANWKPEPSLPVLAFGCAGNVTVKRMGGQDFETKSYRDPKTWTNVGSYPWIWILRVDPRRKSYCWGESCTPHLDGVAQSVSANEIVFAHRTDRSSDPEDPWTSTTDQRLNRRTGAYLKVVETETSAEHMRDQGRSRTETRGKCVELPATPFPDAAITEDCIKTARRVNGHLACSDPADRRYLASLPPLR